MEVYWNRVPHGAEGSNLDFGMLTYQALSAAADNGQIIIIRNTIFFIMLMVTMLFILNMKSCCCCKGAQSNRVVLNGLPFC